MTRLLLRALPPEWRASIEGDLEEESARRGRRGLPRRVWITVHIVVLIARLRLARWTESWTPRRRGGLREDLRYVRRSLARRPGFAATVFVTLALGIAANTAVFTIVNGVLLRDLPYRDPSHLAFMWSKLDWIGVPRAWVSGPHIAALRRESRTVEDIAALRVSNMQLTGTGAPQQLRVGVTTANVFDVLGVQPFIGRGFASGDEKRRVLVLGHALWRQLFGSNAGAVGRRVELNGTPYEVVGVMPQDFRFLVHSSLETPRRADLWTVGDWDLPAMNPDQFAFAALVRVRPAATIAAAQAELDTIGREIDRRDYKSKGFGWQLVGVQEDLVKAARPALVLIAVSAGFVMLVVCANIAGLTLVRTGDRRREFAVRLAMGASRRDLTRLVLLECLTLAVAAGAAGLALAWAGVRLAVATEVLPLPRLLDVSIDPRVLAFHVALSLAVGLIFGALPALRITASALAESLKNAARGSSMHSGAMRSILVSAELALAVVLVSGAVLLFRSYDAVRHVDAGFNPHGVLLADVTLAMNRYPEEAQAIGLHQRLAERLSALPGVQAAGATTSSPLTGGADQAGFTPEGRTAKLGEPGSITSDIIRTTPGSFKALGIEMREGRDFTWQDRAESQQVAIVDERFARAAWSDGRAIGRRMKTADSGPIEIVGVVRHGRLYRLDEDDRPQVFRPYSQDTTLGMTLAIRTTGDPDALAGLLRQALWEIDPKQPIANVTTLDAVVDTALLEPRLRLAVLGVFAVSALLLAALGIYGVLSSLVAGRVREIGIRMALGADARMVRRLILGRTMALAGAGLAVGLAAALAVSGLIGRFLFTVSARDPRSLAATVAVVVVTALVASYLPVRRATSVDPARALRAE